MPRLPKIAIPGPGLFNTHRGLIEYLARVPKLYIQPGNSIILLSYPQMVFYRHISSAKGAPHEREPRGRPRGRPARRKRQLPSGVIGVLDGIRQSQPSMFTKSFPAMLAASAPGNPAVVAVPIN